MTDEKFLYISDQKEKKRTARGSHNRRTHAGAGGRVRLPSDYMTTKERNAMNGECKAYRLNEPMTWKEFKSMPEDLQISYIKALRQRFNPSTTRLAEMFSISQGHFSNWLCKNGLGVGKHTDTGYFDKEGWYKWLVGAKSEEQAEPVEVIPETAQISAETEKTHSEYVGGCEKKGSAERIVHALGVIFGISYALEDINARAALQNAVQIVTEELGC